MTKKKLVISSGAGISAESGIKTFRDADGLWENYPVMDVASHEGFLRDPALIHKFYNERREQLINAQPNAAHLGLVELEKDFDVRVITQNVDDLHERAGSSNVLHLHGELTKGRSDRNPNLIVEVGDKVPFYNPGMRVGMQPNIGCGICEKACPSGAVPGTASVSSTDLKAARTSSKISRGERFPLRSR